jgi:hypothetical protein
VRTTAGDSVIIEPRWPVALANLIVLAVVVSLPGYLRLFPWWFPYVMAVGLLLPMVVVGLSRHKERWLRIERILLLAFILLVAISSRDADVRSPRDGRQDARGHRRPAARVQHRAVGDQRRELLIVVLAR